MCQTVFHRDEFCQSFFNLYMDELNVKLSKLNISCNVNCVHINHMFYGDDSVLLAPSAMALQKMIDICFKYGNDYELKHHFKKTECMWVKLNWLKQLKMPDNLQVVIFTGLYLR